MSKAPPPGVTTLDELETFLTTTRAYELLRHPPPEKFTAHTLQETHRHIFQDFKSYHMDNPVPGEFREPIQSTQGDWQKNRKLYSSPDSGSFVCYSPMRADDLASIDKVLENAQPERLSKLSPKEFAKEISAVYAHLDYVHPFEEGNSRTLRTFTRQLARASGYDLDWDRLSRTDQNRDRLFIARDRAVGEIAVGRIQNEANEIRVVSDMIRFENNPSLVELVTAITRPSRAAVFEHVPGQEAIKAYPELAPAYAALRAVEAKAEVDGLTKAQRDEVVSKARGYLVQQLDRGDVPSVDIREEKHRQPDNDLSR